MDKDVTEVPLKEHVAVLIEARFGRLEERISAGDTALSIARIELQHHLAGLNDLRALVEGRIKSLEISRAYVIGYGAAAGAFAGAMVAWGMK